MINDKLIALAVLFVVSVHSQVFDINLDLPASQRYTQLARIKKESISGFVSYLKKNVEKYKLSFAAVARLHTLFPSIVRRRVGEQFYDECLSISKGTDLPLTEIIVFNYMYELGAATDFCTALTVSYDNVRLLGRNLDYGYQEYLANNSVHLRYVKKGKVIFETLGHAGLIGTHTALKHASDLSPHQFAITMNERVQGGLHLTLQKIIGQKCQTSPYALMRALKQCHGSAEDTIKYLNNQNTCSAVYWTIVSKEGGSYVMEKNRGVGSHKIREAETENNINYIIQTNHDFEKPDPDNRSTAAKTKLLSHIDTSLIVTPQNIWKILTEAPNFNKLTLTTAIIDVQNGSIDYKVWS